MTTLGAVVLDVVVDQAEVVAHLHGRGARQRPLVLARDGLVGEEPQEGPQPLAPRCVPVEAQMEPDPAVQLRRPLVLGGLDDALHLVLGVGDEAVEVVRGQHGKHDTRG